MTYTKLFSLSFFLFMFFFSCDTAQKDQELALKEKELALKEKELALREREAQNEGNESRGQAQRKNESVRRNDFSKSDIVSQAEQKFNAYLPNILRSQGRLDDQQNYTGDFDGDGLDDVIVYFSVSAPAGASRTYNRGLAFYKNMGGTVKVVAGYNPSQLFTFNRIQNGSVYVNLLTHDRTDPACCPSISYEHRLTISGAKVY